MMLGINTFLFWGYSRGYFRYSGVEKVESFYFSMATPQPSGAVSSSLITGPAPNGAVLMCTLQRFTEGRSAPPKKPTKTGTDEAQVPAPNQIPCPGMPEASILHDIRVGSSFPRYEEFSYLESQLKFKKIHAHLLQQERHSSLFSCSQHVLMLGQKNVVSQLLLLAQPILGDRK